MTDTSESENDQVSGRSLNWKRVCRKSVCCSLQNKFWKDNEDQMLVIKISISFRVEVSFNIAELFFVSEILSKV